jgi:hypothetical protein
MSRDELEKLKGEIQSEYLAAFQKTVAMHEVFLLRLATHSVLRTDTNFQVFLEYDQDVRVLGVGGFLVFLVGLPRAHLKHTPTQLAARSKNRKEKALGFLASALKLVDTSFSSHHDEDPFFERSKHLITGYHTCVLDSKAKAETMVKHRATLAGLYEDAGTSITFLGNTLGHLAQLSASAYLCVFVSVALSADHCGQCCAGPGSWAWRWPLPSSCTMWPRAWSLPCRCWQPRATACWRWASLPPAA